MAIHAFKRCVRAEQRKAIFVLLDLLRVLVPPINGVALLAIVPELPAMNIGVAIGAFHSHVLEVQICVALRASHLRVHAAKRVARLIVIEFWNAADRLPTRTCVAVLAWDRDRTVRISRRVAVPLCPRSFLPHRQEQKRIEDEREGDRFPQH